MRTKRILDAGNLLEFDEELVMRLQPALNPRAVVQQLRSSFPQQFQQLSVFVNTLVDTATDTSNNVAYVLELGISKEH